MPGTQLIGAEWRAAADGRVLEVTDPATGQVFATVPDGSAADARAAVDAAVAAFRPGVPRRPSSAPPSSSAGTICCWRTRKTWVA
jgi:acyl-CoA reductase-like NAD-dependent aldehyde dehydrogenase